MMNEPSPPLDSLKATFMALEDGRHAKGRLYPQWLLLSVATLAKLCGYHAFAQWGRFAGRHGYLFELLGFTRADRPCDDTFRYCFQKLNLAAFEQASEVWARQELQVLAKPDTPLVGYALDGKTLRGSADPCAGQVTRHLLSLLHHTHLSVVASCEVDGKENEIPAAERLLAELNLWGMLITADALITGRSIAATIEQREGRYLLALKGNHPQALELVREMFRPDLPPPGHHPNPGER